MVTDHRTVRPKVMAELARMVERITIAEREKLLVMCMRGVPAWEWRTGFGNFVHAVREHDGRYGRARCGVQPRESSSAGWAGATTVTIARCLSCEEGIARDAQCP